MKKSELIKSRYEATIQIHYELTNGCYKCPFFIQTGGYNSDECKGCPTKDKLSELGDTLINITSIYRNAKNIPIEGTAVAETASVVISKSQVRDMLEESFDELEFRIMRSRGKTYNEIGRHYGVSGDMIRRFSRERIEGELPEVNKRKLVDYKAIDKLISYDEFLCMRKKKIKLEDIANGLGITLNALNKWQRKKQNKI